MIPLGGATPTLKILSKEAPFFTGCMENVAVDGIELVPSKVLPQMRVSATLDASHGIAVVVVVLVMYLLLLVVVVVVVVG